MFERAKHFFKNRKLQWQLNKICHESLGNILLNDGASDVFIEKLLLLDDKLLMVKFINYEGYIYAAENIEYWTQLVGRSGYKFYNPIREIQREKLVLDQYFKGIDVIYYIIFPDNCEFPKGRPENVLTQEEFVELTLNNQFKTLKQPDTSLNDMWLRFNEAVTNH